MELVASNAIFVLETEAPVSLWNQLVTQPLWERLSDIHSLKTLENQLIVLDSLAGKGGNLDRALKGHEFLVSLHPIGRGEFDFIFTIGAKEDKLKELIGKLEEDATGRIRKRTYSGTRLMEYTLEDGRVFSYTFVHNVFLGSYTSFLVEDAIRLSKSTELSSFVEKYNFLLSAKEKSGLGILRIGSDGISTFFGSASSEPMNDFQALMQKNRMAANLSLHFEDGLIRLSGLLFDAESGKPVKGTTVLDPMDDLNPYLSGRTALAAIYNVKDIRDIETLIRPAIAQRSTIQADVGEKLWDQGFFEFVEGKFVVMNMESNLHRDKDKILVLKGSETDKALSQLKDFSFELVQGDSAQWVVDEYLNNEIFLIAAEEFPSHLLKSQIAGFTNSYVTKVKDMLVFGNSMRAMKDYLDDLYNDNVWGKSIVKRKYLEAGKKNSYFSQYFDVNRLYGTLLRGTTSNWEALFQRYEPQLKAIQYGAIHFYLSEDGTKVDISLHYQLEPIQQKADINLAISKSASFPRRLIHGPTPVENFNDQSTEFIVQDDENAIHLVNGEGDLIFSQSTSGPIVSPVFQIDYYKNQKLQMVFATKQAIYAFDRFGEPLPNFPIRLPDEKRIAYLNVVDYDLNREYRMFIGDEEGDLFLFDQHGSLLDGWDPNRTTGSLTTRPAHHRIPGVGDFMVSLHRNGNLELFNRKGERRMGGSIRIGETLNTSYGISDRGGAASQIVTINEKGELVKVNFKGELTYRNQLVRPDRETQFHIVNNQMQDQFLVVIKEFNKIQVLDPSEQLLFEKEIFSEELDFQWFSFGSEKNVFVVIDKVQEFIFLYDLKGKLLNSTPLNGKEEVSVVYDVGRNEMLIGVVFGNTFKEYKLPL